MDLYFWKITEVPSRGTVLMRLEKIPEQVLKGTVFLWLWAEQMIQICFFEHRGP